jgi:hypothetical protein
MTVAGCAPMPPVVADTFYVKPPPQPPAGGAAVGMFQRLPWELELGPDGAVRYHHEAHLRLPDLVDSFRLTEILVYASDGSNVQLEYVSPSLGKPAEYRVVIQLAVYRAPAALATEWKSFEQRWHENPPGTLTEPLLLPADWPVDTKQMAWTIPVGDGREAPGFEERVLFQNGGWSVRCEITCAVEARAVAAKRIVAFLRSIRAPPPAGSW